MGTESKINQRKGVFRGSTLEGFVFQIFDPRPTKDKQIIGEREEEFQITRDVSLVIQQASKITEKEKK
tara:strand:- start:358 stop:561 length:204 start_codon:yes stop_codon:yes gene_type:complete